VVSLLLHREDGVVKARCRECNALCEVPPSSTGEAVCGKCVRKQPAYTGQVLTARDFRRAMGETR
jgi:hypothetical protein